MARKGYQYKRLPGRPFSMLGVRSLWQGPDHLLWTETFLFKEHYKRFFYTDIQSMVMQRSDTHWLWFILWGALGFICGLIAFLVPGTPYVSGTFTAICLLALGVNLVLGPSCSVYLQTGVQVQKLTSLRRVRTGEKTMSRIKAMVEASQGPWEKQHGSGVQDPVSNGSASPLPVPAAAADRDAWQKAPTETFNPLLHHILFGLLLVLGALALAQLLLRDLAAAVLEILLHGMIQIVVIVALVRWHQHLKGTLIAKINWLALVFVAIQTALGYGLYFATAFRNPLINYHHWEMFKMMFQLQMADHPLALTGNLIYACGSLLLGIFGLLVIRRR